MVRDQFDESDESESTVTSSSVTMFCGHGKEIGSWVIEGAFCVKLPLLLLLLTGVAISDINF